MNKGKTDHKRLFHLPWSTSLGVISFFVQDEDSVYSHTEHRQFFSCSMLKGIIYFELRDTFII